MQAGVLSRLASRARLKSSRLFSSKVPLGKLQPESKFLQFTCTSSDCEQDSEQDRVVQKFISTKAYEQGVVLVRCNCDKLHLVADRLGWFQDGGTTIQDLAERKGIDIKTGVINVVPQDESEDEKK